ncbi:uncharacterized protein MONOS_6260 [Monocercomonoides exilis]|uniref:uncharacterized protein n=1 Tax=Monocercomonoides exilis TaxID=2049356 RepID=UPI00355A95D8|nr:hypothetical protein MONOS_6260 [Monocercomonoides exilis]|eukprot:MONOS_6260.1-p1 / transcript=MONOS_6260.1 / gene=MONOS_6260 / organism=Monocercomonoides_exilis_PA203 / gene_product=unspecified product / transcript_product=unspecified product / location=Mono_scaffold00194:92720-93479(+) / protein_length=144 / sequence_SO=supercontig / SO=protein_coding / is_pseudo=false
MWMLAAQQSSLRSAPSSSSTGAARRSTSPFRRRRSDEKKAAGDDQPSSSSAPAIDPSDASAVATSYTSVGAMDDIERRLGSRLESRSPQLRRVAVKLDDEVMRRGVAVREVGEIVEKGLEAVGLRMEDEDPSLGAIALTEVEE